MVAQFARRIRDGHLTQDRAELGRRLFPTMLYFQWWHPRVLVAKQGSASHLACCVMAHYLAEYYGAASPFGHYPATTEEGARETRRVYAIIDEVLAGGAGEVGEVGCADGVVVREADEGDAAEVEVTGEADQPGFGGDVFDLIRRLRREADARAGGAQEDRVECMDTEEPSAL